MHDPTPTLPSGLMELAAELEAGWSSKIAELEASGTPLNVKHPLLDTVQKVDGELKELRTDAGTKHQAMVKAQTAVAEATTRGESIDETHDLFKKLDQAGKDYGEISDSLQAKEVFKARLVEQMGQAGLPAGGDGPSGDDYRDELKQLFAEGGFWQGEQKSIGERVTDNEEYQERKSKGDFERSEYGGPIELGKGMDRRELKALLTSGSSSSAGAFVRPDRQGYFPLPLRPLTVLDLITIGQTDSNLVEYVKMLSLTNSAAEVKEAVSSGDIDGSTVTTVTGGAKPESGMAFAVVQAAVQIIAHWVPATKPALSDAGQLSTIIDGALTWGLGDRLEREIVNGSGTAPNLRGILQTTGIQHVAAGATSHADKVHNAATKIRVAGYQPTGVIMNPLDAEVIWLSRDSSGGAGTGGYLFGAPNNPGPRTLWGLPVAETPACPQGTAMVGNLASAVLWLREGTQIIASDSHKDWFTRNLVAILAEMRAAFGLPLPEAFCDINLAAS